MDFENSQYYTNRELSWIQFNYRVLEEARDKSNPLFERLKFWLQKAGHCRYDTKGAAFSYQRCTS